MDNVLGFLTDTLRTGAQVYDSVTRPNQVVNQTTAATPSANPGNTTTAATPFWKQPVVLIGAAVAVVLGLFLVLRK